MKEIELTQNQVALVDDEDFERVNQFKWCARWDNVIKSFRALRVNKQRKTVYMARFLVDCPDSLDVDHRNHVTLDNQRYNLRICTTSENCRNSRKGRGEEYSSIYKGVDWYKKYEKWRARITIKDIFNQSYTILLGYFRIEEEAAKAYDKVAKEEFEEFACLNFKGKER